MPRASSRQPGQSRATHEAAADCVQSDEADVYPRNHPARAEEIDAAIGEFCTFRVTNGYDGHGVDPATAILPHGREQRVVRLSNTNTGGAAELCVDVRDLALWKYAAGRAQDVAFNGARGMASSASASSSGSCRRCRSTTRASDSSSPGSRRTLAPSARVVVRSGNNLEI